MFHECILLCLLFHCLSKRMSLWFMSEGFNMPREGCFWSEWMAKTQGSRDSQAMICPPVEKRDGTLLSANGGVHWDWAKLSLWAFRTFSTDLIHLEIKTVFPSPHGSFRTGRNGFPKDDNKKSFLFCIPSLDFIDRPLSSLTPDVTMF